MQEEDHVEPQDPNAENSPKLSHKPEAKPFGLAPGEHAACYWNDKKYSDGATVCDSKRRYECWNGKWVEIGSC